MVKYTTKVRNNAKFYVSKDNFIIKFQSNAKKFAQQVKHITLPLKNAKLVLFRHAQLAKHITLPLKNVNLHVVKILYGMLLLINVFVFLVLQKMVHPVLK